MQIEVDELDTSERWLDLQDVELKEEFLDLTPFETVEIVGSRLVGVRLVTGPETLVVIRDSVIEQCDLSRMRSESVLRSQFSGCKLAGAELTGSVIDSDFADCSFTIANLTSVQLTRVAFTACKLTDVDLFDARLQDVSFDDCQIEALNLDRTQCERVDFRSAETLGFKAGRDMSGCLLSVAQTLELALWSAHQLGFSIEEPSGRGSGS